MPSFHNKGQYNFLVMMGMAVALLMVLAALRDYAQHIIVLPYSTFQQRLAQGSVKKIEVQGQEIKGLLKDNTSFETVIPTKDQVDILKAENPELEVTVVTQSNAAWYWMILLALALGLAVVLFLLKKMQGSGAGGGSGGVFSIGKSKARMYSPSSIKERFSDVAGADEAKEELVDLVEYLKDPKKYQRLGAKVSRGILLVGEPGNGKTLLAKAVAGEANCYFFSISGSDFMELFVGVGASRVRDLFQQARSKSPAIIFIDEIDAIGRHRGSGMGGGHDEREQTLNQLLTEMDGFETVGGAVIVLAATNRPDVLDKALLRPGRFDKQVNVPYPDLVSREKILAVHARNFIIDPSVDLAKIARGTPGFSGASLANLINEAAMVATKLNHHAITIADFEEARDKVLLGKESKTMMQSPEELKITAFHEAGHALVSLLIPSHSDPLHKITIVPRGFALGVTHSIPEKDKYSVTATELKTKLMHSLGGRIAEELAFNEATTGAYSDFQKATEIARKMVCSYGMSEKMGPVVYGQRSGDFPYSQKAAELIDAEVQRLLDDAYAKTVTLFKENREKLDLLALTLLEKETLYAAEIYELLGLEPRHDHKFI